MKVDWIFYHNRKYKLRVIYLPRLNHDVNIASTFLEKKLMNDLGNNYISKEAQEVDERIYFFVDPKLFALSDRDLLKVLRKNTY
ncbi:MAG TPA: hypothetical protein VG603_10010 [Chitinophagales bacterium]|nr:hypothetical protein [Chitinophagales bacterium]